MLLFFAPLFFPWFYFQRELSIMVCTIKLNVNCGRFLLLLGGLGCRYLQFRSFLWKVSVVLSFLSCSEPIR